MNNPGAHMADIVSLGLTEEFNVNVAYEKYAHIGSSSVRSLISKALVRGMIVEARRSKNRGRVLIHYVTTDFGREWIANPGIAAPPKKKWDTEPLADALGYPTRSVGKIIPTRVYAHRD